MPFFSDVQETLAQHQKYIAEFQELFRSNDVTFGAPEDFFRLAPRLAHDGSFREGLTALTKSVQDREEGRLTLTQMLTMIGVATGGQGIEQAGDAGAVPVSLMTVFLAGIGGWNGAEPGVAEQNTAGEAQQNDAAAPQGADGSDDEREARELVERLKAGPPEDIEALTTSLFGGPSQMKEALSRLEMNTLQLKMHLDSIDSRMERIEPHLDDLKSRIPLPESSSPGSEQSSSAEWRGAESRGPESWEPQGQEPVPDPPIKPWPPDVEEPPPQEWAASAPPMKPWPTEKERDLVWEPRGDPNAAPRKARWPEKQIEPEWRGPVREREQEVLPGDIRRPRTLAHGAVPVRPDVPVPAEPERGEDDEDLPIRVPFGEYLDTEEDERGGRRMAVALWVILILLAACVGGFLYLNHGWHGLNDAEHSIGVAFANGKAAVARWSGGQSAVPAGPPVSNQVPIEGANPPVAQPGTAQQQASSPPASAQPAPTPSTQPTSTTTAPPSRAPAATQRRGTSPAAPRVNDHEQAAEAASAKAPRIARSAAQPVVTVMAGSGMPSETPSPPVSVQGVTSTVPIFVDAAQLTALSDPRPDYPHDALAGGITGEVVVQAIVSPGGDVESAQIVSGPAGLLKSSVDAVRRWRFAPYRVNGQPATIRTYIRFEYGRER